MIHMFFRKLSLFTQSFSVYLIAIFFLVVSGTYAQADHAPEMLYKAKKMLVEANETLDKGTKEKAQSLYWNAVTLIERAKKLEPGNPLIEKIEKIRLELSDSLGIKRSNNK